MKLNITPGPWTYTMPKPGKSKAKISGKNWTRFASVYVAIDGGTPNKMGEDNLTAIVTAVNNTYHKGINPEAVPELLQLVEEIYKSELLNPGVQNRLKLIIQKATL